MTITIPSGRTLPLQAKSGGGFASNGLPSGELPASVTITGSGFGVAPNIVLYRTAREASFDPAVVPSGEVGAMTGSNRQTQFDGRGVFAGHNFETGARARVEYIAPTPFRKFRHYFNLAVPDGYAMPGSDGTERTFATASDWKPVWALSGPDGSQTGTGKPDYAMPAHIGSAAFSAIGNSINLGTFRWLSYEPPKWAWNAFNGFGIILDADDSDPVGTPVQQALHYTSPNANTFFKTINQPGYKGNDSSINESNAYYDRFGYSSYAVNTPLNNAQAYYADFYLAVESAPGAGDFKQAVAIGNAATLAACTKLQMKKADSWTDTEIVIPIDSYESATYSHYFVFSPADGTTVVASGSIA